MSKKSREYKADCKSYNQLQSDAAFVFTKKMQSLHGFRANLHGYEMYLKREKEIN